MAQTQLVEHSHGLAVLLAQPSAPGSLGGTCSLLPATRSPHRAPASRSPYRAPSIALPAHRAPGIALPASLLTRCSPASRPAVRRGVYSLSLSLSLFTIPIHSATRHAPRIALSASRSRHPRSRHPRSPHRYSHAALPRRVLRLEGVCILPLSLSLFTIPIHSATRSPHIALPASRSRHRAPGIALPASRSWHRAPRIATHMLLSRVASCG